MSTYARDLDLNLLRVFVVVAEEGSVTAAARRLYLTQPAVSAALKRLAIAASAPLFAKQGRGLVLTSRGQRLLAGARPHLEALVEETLRADVFDAAASERTIRIGLADSSETSLLPVLLRVLAKEAPKIRLVVLPVQFRSVAAAFASGAIELAVTVADDVPAGIRRRPLYTGGFECLYDPSRARVGKKLTRAKYLAHAHVIISYNGDLRGLVEDALGITRDVRVSVPTFHSVGAIVEGSALLATIPSVVARQIVRERPKLKMTALPFELPGSAMELLWRSSLDDDPALRFVMNHIAGSARATFGP